MRLNQTDGSVCAWASRAGIDGCVRILAMRTAVPESCGVKAADSQELKRMLEALHSPGRWHLVEATRGSRFMTSHQSQHTDDFRHAPESAKSTSHPYKGCPETTALMISESKMRQMCLVCELRQSGVFCGSDQP
jgi:hypothetical protein